MDEPTRITLEKVIQQRRDITVPLPETGHSVKYLFIDLKDEQYGSDMSRIVEITYNDSMLETAYQGHMQSLLLISIMALVIGICSAFLLSRYLLKPISAIVRGC